MKLDLNSYQGQRLPDWAAAATAGFAAGAVLMVLELFWSALVSGNSPWAVSHMIAAIVIGPTTLQSADFAFEVIAIALVAHYVLGVIFGLVLAVLIAAFRLDSSAAMVAVAGAVFGLALYLLNFYGMSHFFAWLVDWRSLQALVTHLIFGMTAALFYRKLNRG